ncbi:MAG TPA: Hsp20/alpha crystallin family protein [Nitrosomonas mobilis]|nr:Hsp20/alpha crystallin family protein [Nitrosomonas mobilis]
MSTFHQLKEGLNEAWGTLIDGWQRLYRRAAGAITRFTPGKRGDEATGQELAVRSTGWGVLASEVFDDDDKIVIRLEAPGMDKGDFDLQVQDDYLVIRGEKRLERESTEGNYHVTECAYGHFERAIPLSDEVVSDKARATYKEGVLRVELPKSNHGRRKKVTVEIK